MPHEIMSYETWMDLTKRGILKPRSKELKLVDAALKEHHTTKTHKSRTALSTALESWLVKKGKGWKSNERNRNHAVEHLRKQIHLLEEDPEADANLKLLAQLPFFGLEMQADEEAREFIRQHRRTFIVTLFAGKKLETRSEIVKSEAREATERIAKVTAGGVTIAKAAGAATANAQELVRKILGDAFPDIGVDAAAAEVASQVLPGFVSQLVAAATPYVGLATAGGKTVIDLGNAITAEWRSYVLEGHKSAILAGDPAAAADAIQRLIQRESNAAMRNAGIHAASATARALLLAFPGAEAVGGPVIGGAEAFASLVHQIYLVGRDWREKSLANAIMGKPSSINTKVFEVCPILGCYLVLCSDDSNVVNLLVEDFGWPGWQENASRMISKHVRPMQEQARRLVHDSRYQIAALQGFAHVRQPPSKLDKLKDRLKTLESLQDIAGDVVTSLS